MTHEESRGLPDASPKADDTPPGPIKTEVDANDKLVRKEEDIVDIENDDDDDDDARSEVSRSSASPVMGAARAARFSIADILQPGFGECQRKSPPLSPPAPHQPVSHSFNQPVRRPANSILSPNAINFSIYALHFANSQASHPKEEPLSPPLPVSALHSAHHRPHPRSPHLPRPQHFHPHIPSRGLCFPHTPSAALASQRCPTDALTLPQLPGFDPRPPGTKDHLTAFKPSTRESMVRPSGQPAFPSRSYSPSLSPSSAGGSPAKPEGRGVKEDHRGRGGGGKEPRSTSGPSRQSAPGRGGGGDSQNLWPAWVYCTRYSDRPSSGKKSTCLVYYSVLSFYFNSIST